MSAVPNRVSACFFCSSQVRHHRKCTARDAVCCKCQNVGHYSKVYKRGHQKAPSATVSTSAFHPTLHATQQAPDCLSFAVTEAIVGDKQLSVLIDPRSSLSYVNESTAKILCLSTHKSSLKVSMVVDPLQGTISRHCFVEVTLQGVVYNSVYLGVMKDLCYDLFLGKAFQRQHRRVIFEYDGTKPELVVSSLPPQTCAVAAAKPERPSLFDNLKPDCRPVSIPSRRYSGPDAAFIEWEVKRLYMNGIIRPSKSTWHAQPVVAINQETGKQRLCMDYSQTINLCTVLDAFPFPRIEVISLSSRNIVFSSRMI